MSFKKRKYLIILTFGGVFLLIIFLVVLPLLTEIKADSQELKEQQKNLIKLQTELANLQRFQEKYQNLKELQRIKNFFVNPDLPVDFISFLEQKAKREQLSLEISTLSPKQTPEEQYPSLRFLLKSEGPFPHFYNFLAVLEKAPYLIEIETLNISLQEEEKEQPSFDNIIKASLLLKVYTR